MTKIKPMQFHDSHVDALINVVSSSVTWFWEDKQYLMKMDLGWKRRWTLNPRFWEEKQQTTKKTQGEEGDDKPYKINNNMHVRCEMQKNCRL
jgi:hypothetical protein